MDRQTGRHRQPRSACTAMALASMLALAPVMSVSAGAAEPRVPLPAPFSMAYYESWSELPGVSGPDTLLAATPAHVDVLAVGFAKPDLVYRGDLNLDGTGIQVPVSGQVLAEAIAALKTRAPSIRVLISVGGSGYMTGWSLYDPAALARLVRDLGADGIDLDYEPADPGCQSAEARRGPTVVCLTDTTWTRLIARTRAALPRPMMLAVPAWSTGAYGTGDFLNDRPPSPHTGSMLWLGRDREAAAAVDMVSIMAYAGGPAFQPERAFDAYRAIWDGPLALGLIVPPDPTGQTVPDMAGIRDLAARLAARDLAGIMIYGMLGTPPGGGDPSSPSGMMMLQAVCEGFGGETC
ncbi:glycoside hydrolase family 18 protein [Tistrella sp. BH-R2-4]|uniref:Glycoside hydrolase family 18 protein n=1 Tax=Tistrella arctica TaxID=3133430 RepID=A0ABU9YEU2_9PROT